MVAVHFILHHGDVALGIQSGLEHMGLDHEFPKNISCPLDVKYNKLEAYKEHSLAKYTSELRMEVYLQFMMKASWSGKKICGLIFAGKEPLTAAIVSGLFAWKALCICTKLQEWTIKFLIVLIYLNFVDVGHGSYLLY